MNQQPPFFTTMAERAVRMAFGDEEAWQEFEDFARALKPDVELAWERSSESAEPHTLYIRNSPSGVTTALIRGSGPIALFVGMAFALVGEMWTFILGDEFRRVSKCWKERRQQESKSKSKTRSKA